MRSRWLALALTPVMAATAHGVEAFERAEWLGVVRVVEVGESPGFWCGGAVSRQPVTYQPLLTLRGPEHDARFVAHHLVLSGSPEMDPARAALRESLVHPGAVRLLAADRHGWWIVDAAPPADAAAIQSALALELARPRHTGQVGPARARGALIALAEPGVPSPLALDAGLPVLLLDAAALAALGLEADLVVEGLAREGDALRIRLGR